MGSKSTQSTQIPAYIEEAGKLGLQRAQEIQAMGYVPYMGPEVAAINPYEQAMATNVGSMASAFGLAAPVGMDMGGMPTVTQGGMTGYSSYPAYMASLERLRETRPEMYDYFSGMTRFDPITGALNPEYDARMQAALAPQVATPSGSGGGSDDGPNFAPAPTGSGSGSGQLFGGFTSVVDMFDGGGAGASGSTYSSGIERGPISTAIFGD